MSCNGCRVLRKGCSENCSIRPCLQWIKNPESQANATVFLAKFYGRAGLMNLINSGPEHLRPAIFRSLLYEACGRIVNPIYGSVGLLWSGSWQLCQAAVEAVLKGAPITQITSEAAVISHGPPLKAYDIRHVSKDENSAASTDLHKVVKSRCRFKRSAAVGIKETIKPIHDAAAELGWNNNNNNNNRCFELNRSMSHDSSVSHPKEAPNVEGESRDRETESIVSVEPTETSMFFGVELESNNSGRVVEFEDNSEIGLELTLGFEPRSSSSRACHVGGVKKHKKTEVCFSSDGVDTCKMELVLD